MTGRWWITKFLRATIASVTESGAVALTPAEAYQEWFRDVVGRWIQAPNTWPATSWSPDTPWGARVLQLMTEVEHDYAASLLEALDAERIRGPIVEFRCFPGRLAARAAACLRSTRLCAPVHRLRQLPGVDPHPRPMRYLGIVSRKASLPPAWKTCRGGWKRIAATTWCWCPAGSPTRCPCRRRPRCAIFVRAHRLRPVRTCARMPALPRGPGSPTARSCVPSTTGPSTSPRANPRLRGMAAGGAGAGLRIPLLQRRGASLSAGAAPAGRGRPRLIKSRGTAVTLAVKQSGYLQTKR